MSWLKNFLKRILKASGFELHRRRLHVWTTYPQAARFLYFQRMFDRVGNLGGDVIECGVGHGTSFAMLAFLVQDEGKNRALWGFDSFIGYPEPTKEDSAGTRKPKKGDWGGTSVADVQRMLSDTKLDSAFAHSNVHVVAGYFQDSLAAYTGNSIALLHLDVNLHDSYITCLEQLYPRVMQGGAILFDEYSSGIELSKMPGAKKAIDAFLQPRGDAIEHDPRTDKAYVIKKNPRTTE